jgi:hypothetical protein
MDKQQLESLAKDNEFVRIRALHEAGSRLLATSHKIRDEMAEALIDELEENEDEDQELLDAHDLLIDAIVAEIEKISEQLCEESHQMKEARRSE